MKITGAFDDSRACRASFCLLPFALRSVLVLGIGNVLMGDEGVGVHAIDALADEDWPEGVTLLDGGTGGFHLLGTLRDYERVILIDACADGRPAGTLGVLRPRYASDFPRSLTAHDIGLRDLIEAASVLHALPDLTLITVSILDIRPMTMRLSPAVAQAIPKIGRLVRTLLHAPVGAVHA